MFDLNIINYKICAGVQFIGKYLFIYLPAIYLFILARYLSTLLISESELT